MVFPLLGPLPLSGVSLRFLSLLTFPNAALTVIQSPGTAHVFDHHQHATLNLELWFQADPLVATNCLAPKSSGQDPGSPHCSQRSAPESLKGDSGLPFWSDFSISHLAGRHHKGRTDRCSWCCFFLLCVQAARRASSQGFPRLCTSPNQEPNKVFFIL